MLGTATDVGAIAFDTASAFNAAATNPASYAADAARTRGRPRDGDTSPGAPLLRRAFFGGTCAKQTGRWGESLSYDSDDSDDMGGRGMYIGQAGVIPLTRSSAEVPLAAERWAIRLPTLFVALLKTKVFLGIGFLLALACGVCAWSRAEPSWWRRRPAVAVANPYRFALRSQAFYEVNSNAIAGGLTTADEVSKSRDRSSLQSDGAHDNSDDSVFSYDFDCTFNADRWRETWSLKKAKYCCPMVGVACEALVGTVKLVNPNIEDNDPVQRERHQKTASGSESDKYDALAAAIAAAIDSPRERTRSASAPYAAHAKESPSGRYNCTEGGDWTHTWSVDRKRHCCLAEGRGCDDEAFAAIRSRPSPGARHAWESAAADRGFDEGSRLRECDDNPCPSAWKEASTGGYYCKDMNGCRPWTAGVWEGCRDQCTIGHIPRATTAAPTTSTKYRGESLRLFCWSLCSQAYEMDIIRTQMRKGAGIFACDNTAVLTFNPVTLTGGPLGVLETTVVPSVPVGKSKDGTAGNALQFMKAWEGIQKDGQWQRADWTIKVDPDAVILTDRMRMHLAPFSGQNVYVRNCDKPMVEGTMMFGSVEAITHDALAAYFGSNGRCSHEVPWQAWGEDLFMMRCLEHLGVGNVADFSFIQDGVCKGISCSSNWAAGFHPLKSVWAWENCWNQAVAAR
mmetsp:Transcript_1615/g.4382  ORF Transcript_1615/g.4382 Transcript_1615/m.4382 type:complete len:680 (+) Transcript_1615:65-2104(+)